MGRRETEKFTDGEVLRVFTESAGEVRAHPLIVAPKPMTLHLTFDSGVATSFDWTRAENAPFVELATLVRRLALLEQEPVYIGKVLTILGREHPRSRLAQGELHKRLLAAKGHAKVQNHSSSAERPEVSVTSNAAAAEIVINGSLFHATPGMSRAWRSMDELSRGYIVAATLEHLTELALLISDVATLVAECVPDLNGEAPIDGLG